MPPPTAEEREKRRVQRRLQRSAHLQPPVILRGFLSDADMREIFSFGREMQVEDGEGLARYGDEHVALFLHHGGFCHDDCWRTFATRSPALLEKMLTSVRAAAGDAGMCTTSMPLNIRCIELHQYTAGGGLEDPGHYDQGSTLTFSVQLTPPGPVEAGGRFSTVDAAGVRTAYELQAGDAVLFCSEMVHNVSTLTSGERNSLVVELWTGPTNRRDRFA